MARGHGRRWRVYELLVYGVQLVLIVVIVVKAVPIALDHFRFRRERCVRERAEAARRAREAEAERIGDWRAKAH